MDAPNYTIRAAGIELRQVNTLSVRFSMREIADSFTATISDRVEIPAGARVELAIEDRTVLVGEVQNARLVKSAGTRDLTISCYSSARRLVKSSPLVTRRTIQDQSLRQIVEQIVEPFGIVVDVSESARVVADEVIPRVRVKPSQRAFDFISGVAKRQGCVLVSGAAAVFPDREAKSSVRITRVGVRESPIPLVYPGVLAIDFEDDVADVHSQYSVTPRGRGTRDSDGTLQGREGVATDGRVLYSPTIIQAQPGGTSQESLDVQAEWEMRRRAAEGQRVSVEVERWSPNNSQALWWPNTLYRVIDTEEGYDQQLLLASVELSQGLGGALARLEFMPPDAYAILGDRKIKQGRGSGRGGYRSNRAWLEQHSQLVSEIAAASDTVDFDEPTLDLYFKPEDPSA